MMVPQNWWSGNKFMMPSFQAPGILNSNAPFAQPVSPLVQSLLQQSGINFQNNLDGNPSTDSGTADPSQGPSVDVGIGPPSGAPGTGGIGGMIGGIVSGGGFLSAPLGFAIGAAANKATGRKSSGQQAMEAFNNMMGVGGGGPDDGTPGGDDTNAAPGSEATGGNTGIAMGPDADAQQNNPQGTTTNMGDPEGGSGATDSANAGVGNGSGVAGPGDDGSWANGGPVFGGLTGPDPAGPDDGYGALKIGEYVLNDKATADLGVGLLGMLNRSPKARAKVRKTLLGKG